MEGGVRGDNTGGEGRVQGLVVERLSHASAILESPFVYSQLRKRRKKMCIALSFEILYKSPTLRALNNANSFWGKMFVFIVLIILFTAIHTLIVLFTPRLTLSTP